MNLSDYQQASGRTLNPGTPLDSSLNYLLGLVGEAGEVAEVVKKGVYHGHDLDLQALSKELGDVCWYLAAIATEAGTTLEEAQKKTRLLLTLLDRLPLPNLAMRLSIYAVELNTVVGDWRMYRQSEPVAEAIGGCLRCVQAICLEAGLSFGAVLTGNVVKLQARYRGDFSSEASIGRAL